MPARMNIHLIDGTYELFRAFYAVPKQRGASGAEVGATRGLIRSLLALLREPGVTHVACAFDHVIESFRNELFAGYKTSEGIDPELWSQFPLAEKATTALGVVTWPMVEFEADDALATAASRYALDPRVQRILICSPDKDFAQCVRGKVVLWDRMREKILDAAGVREKFGVPPESIPDYLALVGDSADGIPGIPRWGAKSASALLAAVGTIECIPVVVEQWPVRVRGASALAQTLNAERVEASLYKDLATLRTDVPLSESVDDLEWRGADRVLLETLCSELADESTFERVPRFR
jgi:5'-3' exonuclease